MHTPEEIKKLILQARSFTPVQLDNISAGAFINVKLAYGSVRAQALTSVSGNGVVFQTDQGNWYVIGENVANSNYGESKRQISYRVVRPNSIKKYPVKTLYVIYNNQIELSIIYLGGNELSKEIYRADYAFGDNANYWRALVGVKSIEGYLAYDGKNTISQIELTDWFEYWIKINRKEIAFIERWYVRWIHTFNVGMGRLEYTQTFNLGMGTLEYTDDLLFTEDGKRVIKEDQEIPLSINLTKYKTVHGNSIKDDPDFPDLQLAFGYVFTFIEGSIETPRKDGTLSICSLSTTYDIEFDDYDIKITIGARSNITQTYTRPGWNTITVTQNITSTASPVFTYTKVVVDGGKDALFYTNKTGTYYYGGDYTDDINRVHNGNTSNIFGVGDTHIGVPDADKPIGFIAVSELEPFGSFETYDPVLNTEKGFYQKRMGYLAKKNYVDFVDSIEGSSFTDANKTAFSLPAYNITYFDSGYPSTIDYSDLSTSSHVLTTIKYKKNSHITYTIEGTATVTNTIDGEIYQEYQGSLELWDNDDVRFDDYYKVRYRYTTDQLQTLKEQTNIIKLKYGTKNTTLNTSDFGVINLKGGNGTTDVVVSSITLNSESFTITLSNKIKFTKFFNILSVGDAQVGTFKEFDPASFQGNFLMSYEINNKEVLIKGVIEDLPTYNDGSPFILECTITSIKPTPTSFKDHLIMDTGSFYNYWFRKFIPLRRLGKNDINEDAPWYSGHSNDFDFNMIINKSILPTIPLNGTFYSLFLSSKSIEDIQYNYLDNLAFTATINNKTDSIKGNKIYSVVKAEGNKAWVEQWDIKDNGDVKYNKVFQVDYYPLKKPDEDNEDAINILAHSYYPI